MVWRQEDEVHASGKGNNCLSTTTTEQMIDQVGIVWPYRFAFISLGNYKPTV